jgi:hypothetical protein
MLTLRKRTLIWAQTPAFYLGETVNDWRSVYLRTRQGVGTIGLEILNDAGKRVFYIRFSRGALAYIIKRTKKRVKNADTSTDRRSQGKINSF